MITWTELFGLLFREPESRGLFYLMVLVLVLVALRMWRKRPLHHQKLNEAKQVYEVVSVRAPGFRRGKKAN